MGFPFVSFGRANDSWDFPYVDVDGQVGIALTVNHLLERSHERIAFLGWPEGSLSGDSRLEGYQKALEAAGIRPRSDWLIRTQNTVSDGFAGAKQLFGRPEKIRPTAIVCASDMMAIGAMSCAESEGLRIGVDVAVTGFDDHPLTEFLRPPLTTLHQPIDELAQQIVQLLIAEIGKNSIAERQILLAPTLIVRESSSQPIKRPSASKVSR
jgi:DNA-binding LacI/PurR family transcriptional regulator